MTSKENLESRISILERKLVYLTRNQEKQEYSEDLQNAKKSLSDLYNRYSTFFVKERNFVKADEILRKAFKISESLSNKTKELTLRMSVSQNLAKVLLLQSEKEEARKIVGEVLKGISLPKLLYDEDFIMSGMETFLITLADIDFSTQLYESAESHSTMAITMIESFLSSDKLQRNLKRLLGMSEEKFDSLKSRKKLNLAHSLFLISRCILKNSKIIQFTRLQQAKDKLQRAIEILKEIGNATKYQSYNFALSELTKAIELEKMSNNEIKRNSVPAIFVNSQNEKNSISKKKYYFPFESNSNSKSIRRSKSRGNAISLTSTKSKSQFQFQVQVQSNVNLVNLENFKKKQGKSGKGLAKLMTPSFFGNSNPIDNNSKPNMSLPASLKLSLLMSTRPSTAKQISIKVKPKSTSKPKQNPTIKCEFSKSFVPIPGSPRRIHKKNKFSHQPHLGSSNQQNQSEVHINIHHDSSLFQPPDKRRKSTLILDSNLNNSRRDSLKVPGESRSKSRSGKLARAYSSSSNRSRNNNSVINKDDESLEEILNNFTGLKNTEKGKSRERIMEYSPRSLIMLSQENEVDAMNQLSQGNRESLFIIRTQNEKTSQSSKPSTKPSISPRIQESAARFIQDYFRFYLLTKRPMSPKDLIWSPRKGRSIKTNLPENISGLFGIRKDLAETKKTRFSFSEFHNPFRSDSGNELRDEGREFEFNFLCAALDGNIYTWKFVWDSTKSFCRLFSVRGNIRVESLEKSKTKRLSIITKGKSEKGKLSNLESLCHILGLSAEEFVGDDLQSQIRDALANWIFRNIGVIHHENGYKLRPLHNASEIFIQRDLMKNFKRLTRNLAIKVESKVVQLYNSIESKLENKAEIGRGGSPASRSHSRKNSFAHLLSNAQSNLENRLRHRKESISEIDIDSVQKLRRSSSINLKTLIRSNPRPESSFEVTEDGKLEMNSAEEFKIDPRGTMYEETNRVLKAAEDSSTATRGERRKLILLNRSVEKLDKIPKRNSKTRNSLISKNFSLSIKNLEPRPSNMLPIHLKTPSVVQEDEEYNNSSVFLPSRRSKHAIRETQLVMRKRRRRRTSLMDSIMPLDILPDYFIEKPHRIERYTIATDSLPSDFIVSGYILVTLQKVGIEFLWAKLSSHGLSFCLSVEAIKSRWSESLRIDLQSTIPHFESRRVKQNSFPLSYLKCTLNEMAVAVTKLIANRDEVSFSSSTNSPLKTKSIQLRSNEEHSIPLSAYLMTEEPLLVSPTLPSNVKHMIHYSNAYFLTPSTLYFKSRSNSVKKFIRVRISLVSGSYSLEMAIHAPLEYRKDYISIKSTPLVEKFINLFQLNSTKLILSLWPYYVQNFESYIGRVVSVSPIKKHINSPKVSKLTFSSLNLIYLSLLSHLSEDSFLKTFYKQENYINIFRVPRIGKCYVNVTIVTSNDHFEDSSPAFFVLIHIKPTASRTLVHKLVFCREDLTAITGKSLPLESPRALLHFLNKEIIERMKPVKSLLYQQLRIREDFIQKLNPFSAKYFVKKPQRLEVICQITKKFNSEFYILTITRIELLQIYSLQVYCPKSARTFSTSISNADLIKMSVEFWNKLFPVSFVRIERAISLLDNKNYCEIVKCIEKCRFLIPLRNSSSMIPSESDKSVTETSNEFLRIYFWETLSKFMSLMSNEAGKKLIVLDNFKGILREIMLFSHVILSNEHLISEVIYESKESQFSLSDTLRFRMPLNVQLLFLRVTVLRRFLVNSEKFVVSDLAAMSSISAMSHFELRNISRRLEARLKERQERAVNFDTQADTHDSKFLLKTALHISEDFEVKPIKMNICIDHQTLYNKSRGKIILFRGILTLVPRQVILLLFDFRTRRMLACVYNCQICEMITLSYNLKFLTSICPNASLMLENGMERELGVRLMSGCKNLFIIRAYMRINRIKKIFNN